MEKKRLSAELRGCARQFGLIASSTTALRHSEFEIHLDDEISRRAFEAIRQASDRGFLTHVPEIQSALTAMAQPVQFAEVDGKRQHVAGVGDLYRDGGWESLRFVFHRCWPVIEARPGSLKDTTRRTGHESADIAAFLAYLADCVAGPDTKMDADTACHVTVLQLAAIVNLENCVAGADDHDEPPTTDADTTACHVTLLQMAAIVNRGKRTLERRKQVGELPPPDVKGGGGQPAEWRWDTVRPILQIMFDRPLPDVFPADRFLRE